MNRKVLLVEPNYKNKYPPMALMKLASYFRELKDDVRFYKGDLKDLVVQNYVEDICKYFEIIYPEIFWKEYIPVIAKYIRYGKRNTLEEYDIFEHEEILDKLNQYRRLYKNKDYFNNPQYDVICIQTLFTFYWDVTIDTINFCKNLCKDKNKIFVGGIMSSLLPDEVECATGIRPIIGLLNKPGLIDLDNDLIVDEMPLDYSILDEIDYSYPANNAYFAYMTRGCINHCGFCAVPKLEPEYCDYISLKDKIERTQRLYGSQKNLLLLDNNVLASHNFAQIIDEIKECGFAKGAKFTQDDMFSIVMNNLKNSINDRAYIKKAYKIFEDIMRKLKSDEEKKLFYEELEKYNCDKQWCVTKEGVLALEKYVRPLYEKTHKTTKSVKRIVDFNQGIDSRLINDENMEKLAEVNIEPLRIAFDHWELREIYESSIRTAVKHGIKHLSNYLLYNFQDKPEDLYGRMRMNVELCDKLDVTIYSFPMKYHPINDAEFFKNRDYIGKHWNRKFIRAVQAVLNSTKGSIGKGLPFFEEAFGKNIDEFFKILWMPEPFIIYRRVCDKNLRERLKDRYKPNPEIDNDLTNEWWNVFNNLDADKLEKAKEIIAVNAHSTFSQVSEDEEIDSLLRYYRIHRDDITRGWKGWDE